MMEEEIKQTIRDALKTAEVYILDPQNDGIHLQALVISPDFEKKSLVEQHQMVLSPLRSMFNGNLHALGLKTFTPSQWHVRKSEYNL